MKISFLPKSLIGGIAFILSICFVFVSIMEWFSGLFQASGDVSFPLTTVVGILCFIGGIIAFINKDRAIGTLIPIVLGFSVVVATISTKVFNVIPSKDFKIKTELSVDQAGIMGNETVNFYTVAEDNGWIYYVYENNLYKRKYDWTQKTLISTGQIGSIYISDSWIYYIENIKGGIIYRMKLDGSNLQMIVEFEDVLENNNYVVDDGWIYFVSDALYKVKIDGTQKNKLVEGGIQNIMIVGNWVYYVESHAEVEGVKESKWISNLCRIQTDGTQQNIVVENTGVAGNDYYVVDRWVYYIDYIDNQKAIFKIALDGTQKTEIRRLSSSVFVVLFTKDFIYYSTGGALYRVDYEGNAEKKLNDITTGSIHGISGDWFYMHEYGGVAYRVKLDGTIGTILN